MANTKEFLVDLCYSGGWVDDFKKAVELNENPAY